MTGYGQSQCTSQQFLINCEIKTFNSKFLDITSRIPKELNQKESDIRNAVSDSLKRGKILFTLNIEPKNGENEEAQVDEELFKIYYRKYLKLAKEVNAKEDGLIKIALESPEVVKPKNPDFGMVVWSDVKAAIDTALSECMNFRENEGCSLEKKLTEYIQNIQSGLYAIEAIDEKKTENLRSKLERSLEEIRDKVQVDENRFEQELIFYLERLDISEEKVRLAQHLKYFMEVLEKEEAAGKKLGFVAQEIGREINTIGSKANDANMQRNVIQMKDELEKIKEQVLNIL